MIVISNGQYNRIYEKWLTGDDRLRNLKKYFLPAVAGAIAITLSLVLWLAILRGQAKRRTAELESANAALELEIGQREQMEAGLRKSEERFSKFFLASPVATAITRFSDGKFVDVNDAFLRLFGYTREQLIGQDSVELGKWVNPEDRANVVEVLQKQSRIECFETQFRRNSGEIMDAIVSAEVIEMAGEKHILSLTQDITARKRAEEVLREGEEFKNCILNSVHSCIAVLNRNGVIVMVNEPWVRFSVENSRVEGFPALHTGIGVNYLEICRDSAEKSCERGYVRRRRYCRCAGRKTPNFYFRVSLPFTG